LPGQWAFALADHKHGAPFSLTGWLSGSEVLSAVALVGPEVAQSSALTQPGACLQAQLLLTALLVGVGVQGLACMLR